MKLRAKFLLMVSITSTVLLVVTMIGYFYAKDQVTENIKNEMYSVASNQSRQVDGWLLRKAQTAMITSQNIQTVLGDNPIPLSFVQHYKADSSILDLYVGLENGVFIDGAESALPAGYDPRQRGWYKQAKEKNKLIFTDFYVDALTKKNVVTVATPLKSAAGNLRGVVGIDIALDFLSEVTKEISLNGKGYGSIIDQNGIILAHPDAKQVSTNINDHVALKKLCERNTH